MKPFDVVHLATDWMSFMVPDVRTKKVIVTCHDLFTFGQVKKNGLISAVGQRIISRDS